MCATLENCARREWEKTPAVLSHFSCDSLVTNSFHEILFLEIAQGSNFIICQNTIAKNVYVSLSVNKFVGSGMKTNFKLPS